jgi:hypothetical protein
MTAMSDFVALELAALSRIVPAPTGPLGYGVDMACVTDLSVRLTETSQASVTGIGESILRRLQTPRGFLGGIDDDPNYGIDVAGLLSEGTTQQGLRGVEASVREEITRDDRVLSATVSATYTSATSTLDVSAQCVARDPSIGQFSLVFSVDSTGKLASEVG